MVAALGLRLPPLPRNRRSFPDARGLVPPRPSPSTPPSPPPLVSGLLFFPLHKGGRAPSTRALVDPLRCHGGGSERQWLEKCNGLDQDEVLERDVVRTLLIDNYDSYTYNIYQELSVVNGVPPVVIRNDEWTWEYMYHCLYEMMAFDNIVISPGPGTPACPKDLGICIQVLRDCKDIPILGVCLGHQALGFVHGAHVVHASEPIHGRLSEIEHADCDLFSKIPSGVRSGFKVVRYHSLVIDPETLPKELIPIAWTVSLRTLSFLETQKHDMIQRPGNDMSQFEAINKVGNGNMKYKTKAGTEISNEINKTKVLMGIMHSSRPHYGVQFHPESVGTQHGRQLFKNFKKITLDYGLRKLKVHDRQVDKIVEELSTSKLACETTTMRQSDVFRASMLAVKDVDTKYLKLKWRKIDSILDQVGGSENIFCKLFGEHKADDTFWLDSSSTDKNRARFSFMGGRGGLLWKQLTFRLSEQRAENSSYQNGNGKRILKPDAGGYLTIRDFHESSRTIFLKDGFFDFLKKELNLIHYDQTDFDGLPFDFFGGFVGYLGYDLKVECGASANRHKSETPDACFFFADNLVVIDHLKGDVYILSLNNKSGSDGMDNNEMRDCSWLFETEQRLLKLRAVSTKKLNREKIWDSKPASSNDSFKVEKSRNQYIKDVRKCLELIRDGESYELCLTTQMRKSTGNIDKLKLYLDLRNRNPAPYAAWLNFSNENLCICCSSPERFLQLDRNNILEAKPIKGTIARGRTPTEDERRRLQLQYSEKDQAENLMIVDLLRNDLGQVCEPGSVHVPCLMEVESYATVHTMVSTIQGKRKPDVSAIDCVRAAFPGGSMTGAPKLRSMEILDSLESSSRGIYSGCIGFFAYNQTFDLNIVIRTIVMHKEEASVGAGGAIVALSQSEDEYAEMMLKAKAPTRIIEDCSEDVDFCGSSMTMVI